MFHKWIHILKINIYIYIYIYIFFILIFHFSLLYIISVPGGDTYLVPPPWGEWRWDLLIEGFVSRSRSRSRSGSKSRSRSRSRQHSRSRSVDDRMKDGSKSPSRCEEGTNGEERRDANSSHHADQAGNRRSRSPSRSVSRSRSRSGSRLVDIL